MKNLIKKLSDKLFDYWFPKRINLTPEELLDEIYRFCGENDITGEQKVGLIEFREYLLKK